MAKLFKTTQIFFLNGTYLLSPHHLAPMDFNNHKQELWYMIKKIIYISLIFVSTYAFAKTKENKIKKVSRPNSTKVMQNPSANLALSQVPFYEIIKDGQKAYLLGTIHYGVNFSSLPSYVLNQFQQANTVIVETDMAKVQQQAQALSAKNPKKNLKEQLTSEEWEILFNASKPLLAQNIGVLETSDVVTANSVFMLSFFPLTKEPMDMFLYVNAARTGKNLMFLEDVKFQIDLLAKTLTLKYLKEQLKTPKEEAQKSVSALLNAYKSADLSKLEEVIYSEVKTGAMTQNQFDDLFDKRNLNWIPKIDSIIKNPGVEFFAVGAGHLAGEKGLVKLLRDNGYIVIKYQGAPSKALRSISSQ